MSRLDQRADLGYAARASEARSSAYLATALDCVVMADASGRIVEFNPAAERTFGYTRAEALGRTLAELIVPPSLRDQHTRAFARFVETGEGKLFGRRLELTGMRADGSEFPVELALSRVEGEPLLVCGALRDLSEAKQAESELLRLAEQQAALRRVATLVAQGARPEEVFAAVAEEVAQLLDTPLVGIDRFEPDGSSTVVGAWGDHPFQVGTRSTPDGPSLMGTVHRTGRSARIDDYDLLPGTIAGLARKGGVQSAVGVPIIVDGTIWGLITAGSANPEPLPEDTEDRLADFTEVVAIAIANTQARDDLRESEALYRKTIAQAGGVPYVYDYAEDRYTFIGEGIEALTGYTATEFTTDRWGEMIEETILLGEQAGLTNDDAVRRTRSGEFAQWRADQRITTRAGEVRWISDASVEIRGRDGRSLGSMGMLQDITERKLIEEEARRLADEQAALRRVATLVAREATPADVFDAVAREAAAHLDAPLVSMVRYEPDGTATVMAASIQDPFPVGTTWSLDGPSIIASVRDTGRPARVDDYAQLPGTIAERAREAGIQSAVGVPIRVERETWGAMVAVAPGAEPLPHDTESRLAGFTELAAAAISSAQARDDLRLVGAEQAALRRVATLVGRGTSPSEVFATVAEEVGQLIGVDVVNIVRHELDDTATAVASWSAIGGTIPLGSQLPLGGPSIMGTVARTGRPARIDSYADAPGAVTYVVEGVAIRAGVGAPIVVDGRVWGTVVALSAEPVPLPDSTEARLSAFTELAAVAISSTQARDDLRRLAEEQASLRRVATLVAQGPEPREVFAAVAAEVAQALDVALVSVVRFEPAGTAVQVGAWGPDNPFPVGASWVLDETGVSGLVSASGMPARVDDYADVPGEIAARLAREAGIRSAVGVPIVVDGRVWGSMMALASEGTPLPAGIEARLARFTELVATAIANTQARDDLHGLAHEQAALHRVATQVARGAEPRAVFDAVCEETGRLLGATSTNLAQFTDDGFNLTIAGWSMRDTHVPTGTRLPLEGGTINVLVQRTGAPQRLDSYEGVAGELAELIRERGVRSEIGAPVVVDGRVWGALIAGWDTDEPPREGVETRLANFADLIATAVSNAASQAELIASRARIVAAADEARLKIERDLHDGTQQQLVSLDLDLQLLQAKIESSPRDAQAELERVRHRVATVLDDVREISRGVHPATLSQRGLGPAVRALARRCVVPVELEIDVAGRLPQSIEIAAYYGVSEALANVAKHADASVVAVTVAATASSLHATVRDDGVGGADARAGSGLSGLRDRVEALGGQFLLASPPGAGTEITIELPLVEHHSTA